MVVGLIGNVYTAGVFDLFHAGHMESIMKIIDAFPSRKLIIGVATDKYTKSFKRTPYQTQAERMHTIKTVFASHKNVEVIEDPLESVECSYEKWFYDKYGITDHCQGTDFDENPQCYAYIKSINGFHIMGRSTLMSTTELINKLTPTRVIKLEGDTNRNYRLGNILIKHIVHGDVNCVDYAYEQLLKYSLFGVTSYQRFGNLVFLPYIEGNVSPNISFKQITKLMQEIKSSPLKPNISLLDLFDMYDFKPDMEFYTDILDENMLQYVCHGDLAYTNVVKNQTGIYPIDWEFLLYGTRYWDLGCYIASVFIYNYVDCRTILDEINELDDSLEIKKNTMLLCDYWIQWSVACKQDYFSNELKMLRAYLAANL